MLKASTFIVIFGFILFFTTINARKFNYIKQNQAENEYEKTQTVKPTSSIPTRISSSLSSSTSSTSTAPSSSPSSISFQAVELPLRTIQRTKTVLRKTFEERAINGLRYAIPDIFDIEFKTQRGDSRTIVTEYYSLLPGTSYLIYGSMVAVHQSLINDNWVFNDRTLTISQPVDFAISITEEEAGSICILQLNELERERTIMSPEIKLMILPSIYNNNKFVKRENFDGIGYLCYRCIINNWIYFIDAKSSEIRFNISNTQTAVASTIYDGNRNISTLAHGGTNYMEDVNRKITVVDCANSDCSSTIYKQTDNDNTWNDSQQQIATQVQWGVSKVLDYFTTVHGRNGLDGSGGPSSILSEDGVTLLLANKIHYGNNQTIAAWTGSGFIYGDGDGVNYGPMVSLDIVAHELSHAIVEFECNLDYTYESGALLESFGDITAAVISQWIYGENNRTWKFGEDVYTPGIAGDAIRYLDEPSSGVNDDPDHVSEMYNGTADNGGVHLNCGIPNKAFYLLAKGGNHTNGGVVMTGIGIEAAYAIWYRAVTVYFLSNTDFIGARSATLYACADLYGQGFKYQSVQTAWGLCGVGSIPNPNPINYISNGGLEVDSSSWTLSGSGVVYVRNGPEKKAGFGYAKLGNSNSVSGTLSQTFSIPNNAVSANLTFWMWCTTSETPNTIIKDQLYLEIENATNGVLMNQLDIFDNTDASATYIQYSFNLLSYMNVPGLRLRFRVFNDGNAPTTFRIDEVYLNVIYFK